MVTISPKDDEKDFLEIGEHKKDRKDTLAKNIHFDKRQYSVKLPTKFMKSIGYEQGDSLVFTVVKPLDLEKKPYLEIRYRRKNEP